MKALSCKKHLDGSKIIGEVNPNYSILYMYDAEGSPIGMQYRKASYAEGVYDVFFFEKNLQGDVVAVYGEDGTKYAEYTYDAWGKLSTNYYNNGGSTGAGKNPFKYRGYYYDSDLRFYYLNSRYYDQNTRRFVNADVYVSTGQGFVGNNMYAYCGNNPVNCVDPNGKLGERLMKIFIDHSLNDIGKNFPVAAELLTYWLLKIGIKRTFGNNSKIANLLKQSSVMDEKVQSALNEYKSSGKQSYSGDVLFDSSGNLDLWLSLRHANYTISIETVHKKNKIFMFYTYYDLVTVQITDRYNFNKPENHDGIGSAFTTIAYYAHKFGAGKDFDITVTYTLILNKRYGFCFE